MTGELIKLLFSSDIIALHQCCFHYSRLVWSLINVRKRKMIPVFNLFGNIACFFGLGTLPHEGWKGQLNLHQDPWLIIKAFKNLSFAFLKIPFESILGTNWLVLGSGSPAPDNASCTSSLFKPRMVAGFVVSPHDGDSVVSSPNPLHPLLPALESEAKNLSS